MRQNSGAFGVSTGAGSTYLHPQIEGSQNGYVLVALGSIKAELTPHCAARNDGPAKVDQAATEGSAGVVLPILRALSR